MVVKNFKARLFLIEEPLLKVNTADKIPVLNDFLKIDSPGPITFSTGKFLTDFRRWENLGFVMEKKKKKLPDGSKVPERVWGP